MYHVLGVVNKRSSSTFNKLLQQVRQRFGSNVSLCHLCFAVACDAGWKYFRRNTNSTSSKGFLFDALMFLNVWSASFRKWAWKWLIFTALVFFRCFLSSVWNRTSKSSNFSFLPSNINLFMNTCSSVVAACDRFWVAIPAIAWARRSMKWFESELWFFGVSSTGSNVISHLWTDTIQQWTTTRISFQRVHSSWSVLQKKLEAPRENPKILFAISLLLFKIVCRYQNEELSQTWLPLNCSETYEFFRSTCRNKKSKFERNFEKLP